ncbi:hypothetical protein K5X82_01615 [Halosquirtibacter xylanolyticus]|uniref:chondroitinase family polysaccharide lyase n=1 Tax=Halosquirtibacter xylanolyticus TaxID=3374599 RepID=UPI003747FBDD|nr:hypothetical protein K5X82_01615 [Prolixibacteraceae bacterium]
MKLTIRIIFCVILTYAFTSVKAYQRKFEERSYESFEKANPNLYKQWIGRVSRVDTHAKNGKYSMCWSAKEGERLIIDSSSIEKALKSPSGGLQCWIYNDTESNDTLQWNVVDNKNNIYLHWGIKLNFKGWQAVWINFKKQAFVRNNIDSNSDYKLVLTCKNSRKIYFDNFEFVKTVFWQQSDDNRYVSKLLVNKFGTSHPWTYTNYWHNLSVPNISAEYINDKESLKQIELIADKYHEWVIPSKTKTTEAFKIRNRALQKFIKEGVSSYDEFKIEIKDSVIHGLPLYSIRGRNTPFFADLSMNVLLPLSLDFLYNKNRSSLDKYINVLNYMNDQGWREGSSLGTVDHEMLRHAGYFHSIYLMKKYLKEEGIYEREMATAKWYLNWNEIYHLPDFVGCTADFMRSVFMYRLLIVLMEDGDQQVQDMHFYKRWIERSLSISPGFADTFKPDHIGYHHRGPYMNAYGPNAYHMASIITWLLEGTAFEISKESKQNLAKCVQTAGEINYNRHIPMGVCGRFPHKDSNYINIVPAIAYLLHVDTDNSNELRRIYKSMFPEKRSDAFESLMSKCDSHLEYVHSLGAVNIMVSAETKVQGIADALNMDSSFMFKPYAGLGIYNSNNRMFSVKGWSAYIWDFESGKKGENLYGRYLSYGALQSFEPNNTTTGFSLSNGFDWSHIPGTTALYLRDDELKYGNKSKKHRNFSDQTFLSGISYNKTGWMGIRLHDTAYDTSFYANKSYLFLNRSVLCMGNMIRSKDKSHECHTTVLQTMFDESVPLKIDGNPFTASDTVIFSKNIVTLSFNKGLTYRIFPNQKLNIRLRKELSSTKNKKRSRVVPNYTVWISHGKSPKEGTYKYEIVWDDNMLKDDCQTLMTSSSHEVVISKGTIYSNIWDTHKWRGNRYVEHVSSPVSLVIDKEGEKLSLSVTDPDMRRPKVAYIGDLDHEKVIAPAKAQDVDIVLKGKLRIKENNSPFTVVKQTSNTTTVRVNCINGISYKTDLYYE